MTTYLDNYNSTLYQTSINDYYNGVLKVSTGINYGTGSLLYDGRSILTAAHLFDGISSNNMEIYLYDGVNDFTLNATVKVFENYDDVNINGDLAIVTFDDTLDTLYNRYNIFRDDAIGSKFTAVGYGDVGSGSIGYIDSNTIYKLKVTNYFDTDLYSLTQTGNVNLSWNPLEDTILTADFDNKNSSDILGYLLESDTNNYSLYEGIIAPGDSGGPAFIDNQVAGIASYGFKVDVSNQIFDITPALDASFGEMAAWQNTSYYQEWIDKTIRDNYQDAPTNKDEVKKIVNETDKYAYFMVEYLPLRDSMPDIVSVDYTTIDGTALAGSDYVATSGTLNLYMDESYAIIAVELISDNVSENDEYFTLEISNPINGSFGEGVQTLTAVRTITEDVLI